MMLKLEDFGAMFTSFTSSAFRIESLSYYAVEEERDEFERFLAGASQPEKRNEDWCRIVRDAVARGATISRVHIVDRAITDYVRFEVEWGYVFSSEAGESIRFAYRDELRDIELPLHDVWLFDDVDAVDMAYDADGQFLYANLNADPLRAVEVSEARSRILDRSFGLGEMLDILRSKKSIAPPE